MYLPNAGWVWGDVETRVSLPEPLGAVMAPGAAVCLPCSLCACAGAVFNQPVGSWWGDCLRLATPFSFHESSFSA